MIAWILGTFVLTAAWLAWELYRAPVAIEGAQGWRVVEHPRQSRRHVLRHPRRCAAPGRARRIIGRTRAGGSGAAPRALRSRQHFTFDRARGCLRSEGGRRSRRVVRAIRRVRLDRFRRYDGDRRFLRRREIDERLDT